MLPCMTDNECWNRRCRVMMLIPIVLLSSVLLVKTDDPPKRIYPFRCSYTKNIFCECGNTQNIISISINACRFDILSRSCGECVTKDLASKMCENFYSCQECGTSLEECLVCSASKNNRMCKKGDAMASYEKPRKLFQRSIEVPRKLRRRQVQGPENCGIISAPAQGKAACTLAPTVITCTGTCNSGYQFEDGSPEKIYRCEAFDGEWLPERSFPPCIPTCKNKCENGGRCEAHNICVCNSNYRGNTCGYPLDLCYLEKTDSASTWQCNHTHVNSMCKIACYPPKSSEAEENFQTHVCSIQGIWDPPVPLCVKEMARTQCPDPGDIPNGRKETSADIFFVGTLVSFVCRDHFILHGESTIVCLPNGKWSANNPVCYQSKAFCPQPIVPENTEVFLYLPGLYFQHDSKDYGSGEIPIRLNQGFQPTFEETFDSPTSPGSLPIGTRVQYQCKSRFYQLYGSEYQTCLPSGSWSGYQPTCIPRCGISDSPRTPFITYGNFSEQGQWPWQIGIAHWVEHERRWILSCGGSLLNERWIITAGHCVTKEHSNTPIDPKTLQVFLGKHYRSFDKDDKFVQIKKIIQVIVHKDYDFSKYDADIALLHLDSPAELTSRVQPICLPTEESTRENIRDGKLGVVTGWGMAEDTFFSETLRQSLLPVVSHTRCEEGYWETHRIITVTKNMFCAGYREGRVDTCKGDSGGPMMFLDETQRPKRWILEGIISWGSGYGCGKPKNYAGFTKVKAFLSWINMHI